MDANACLQQLQQDRISPARAESTAREALARPDADPAWVLPLGYALWLQDRFEEALQHCRHQAEALAGNVDLLILRGMLARRVPDGEEEALAAYEQALQLAPHRADVSYNLGNLHLHAERYSEAIDHYRRSLALDGSNAMGWLNLGIAHRELDQHPQACQALGRSILIRGPISASSPWRKAA